MLKSVFSIFSFQKIVSSLVSFQMIFEALQSELSRFKLYSLGSKLLKIPELNLEIIFLLKTDSMVNIGLNRQIYSLNLDAFTHFL